MAHTSASSVVTSCCPDSDAGERQDRDDDDLDEKPSPTARAIATVSSSRPAITPPTVSGRTAAAARLRGVSPAAAHDRG